MTSHSRIPLQMPPTSHLPPTTRDNIATIYHELEEMRQTIVTSEERAETARSRIASIRAQAAEVEGPAAQILGLAATMFKLSSVYGKTQQVPRRFPPIDQTFVNTMRQDIAEMRRAVVDLEADLVETENLIRDAWAGLRQKEQKTREVLRELNEEAWHGTVEACLKHGCNPS